MMLVAMSHTCPLLLLLLPLLLVFWTTTPTNGHQSKWAPSKPVKLNTLSLSPIKSDQENSLPVFHIDETHHSSPGELGPKDQTAEKSTRASRDQDAATWGRTDDEVEFIRVDRKVQTDVSKRLKLDDIVAKSGQNKLAKLAETNKQQTSSELLASEQPARESVALDSLNRFLLERPQNDLTAAGGAILGRQLGPPGQVNQIGQAAHRRRQQQQQQQTSQSSASITTSNTQFDYFTSLFLDTNIQLDVRAHLGETAYLLCRLRANLQQSDQLQVSWFRGVEILTSGEFRQTSDERFRPSHQSGSGDWLLELHNVRASDEGDYECQVNSAPRSASVKVRLAVIEASVEIVEGPELRVDTGEQVELTCRVQFNSQAQLKSLRQNESNEEDERQFESSQMERTRQKRLVSTTTTTTTTTNWQPYIYWYKDRVYLQDQRVQKEQRNLTNGGLENVLRVNRANQLDSGNYTCKLVPELNEVRPAHVRVFVATSGSSFKVEPNLLALHIGAIIFVALKVVHDPNWPVVRL